MEEYDKYIVGFGVGLLFSGDSNYIKNSLGKARKGAFTNATG